MLGTEHLALRLVGITGTNGKTTTAYLVHSALTALGRHPGLIGTVETRIGDERVGSVRTTPEAPELHAVLAVMEERGLDSCVMEVSSHALAQHRVDGVVYDVALFTNLSQDHLDFHADMDDYFAAKASLFTPERARQGLVCIDDDWGRRLVERSGIPVTTIGTAADADWRIRVDDADPAAFRLTGPGVDLHLRSSLPGDFNVTNTAMAAAALVLLGEDAGAVGEAVLTDPHVPGRMETVAAPDGVDAPRAVVDYAHTPEAIRAALRALRPTTPGQPGGRHRRRWRPRPRQAPPDGRGGRRGRRPGRRHRRQPALGGPGRHPRRRARRASRRSGPPAATSRCSRSATAAPPSRRRSTRSGRRGRPRRSPSSARATRAGRTSGVWCTPSTTAPRWRRRSAGRQGRASRDRAVAP